MRITLDMSAVNSAPVRSFKGRSGIAADFAGWYEGSEDAIGFRLNASEDAGLRTALCRAAGMTQERVPVLNEDGSQAVSEKRGKPQFRAVPFSTSDLLSAMETLGIEQRELSSEKDSDGNRVRTIAFVRTGESVTLADEYDDDDDES